MIHHRTLAEPINDRDGQSPGGTAAVDRAVARLGAAVGLLESAVSRRLEGDRSKSSLETELALMQDDRARLAVELDGALARSSRLDGTAEELARRIDRAIGQVRAVLASTGSDA